METEVSRLIFRMVGDNSSYLKMLRSAEAQTAAAFQNMQMLGQGISLMVGAPLLGIGVAAVRAFSSFDQAMTQSQSIMGRLSPQQIDSLRSSVLSLAGDTVQSPTELARALYELASAGYDAERSVAVLPEMARFATAGSMNLSQAVEFLSSSVGALGLRGNTAAEQLANTRRVMDVLTEAANRSMASVQQFSEALSNDAAAAARLTGKDVEEVVAVLAVYADQGERGMAAGSQLARGMRLLQNAATEHGAAQRQMGLEVFDAGGNMKNMADIVDNLTQVLGPMSDAQRTATLSQMGFHALTQRSLLPLIGMSDAIRTYERQLRSAGGATREVAETQLGSFANQMTVLWNKITVVAIEIGDMLAPALRLVGNVVAYVLPYIRTFVAWFKGLPTWVKSAIGMLALFVVVIGAVLALVGFFAGLIYAGFKLLWAVLARVGAYIAGIGIRSWLAYIAIMRDVAFFTLGFVRVMGGLSQAWDAFKKFALISWILIKQVATAVMVWMTPYVLAALDWMGRAWEWIGQKAETAWRTAVDWAVQFNAWVRPIVGAFVGFISAAWDLIVLGAEWAWGVVVAGALWLWEGIVTTFTGITTLVGEAWEWIMGSSTTTWGDVADTIVGMFITGEFMLRNFGKIWDYAVLGMALSWESTVGIVTHFFTGTVPAVTSWFLANWRSLWADANELAVTSVRNLSGNIVRIFRNLPGLIAGTTAIEDIWENLGRGALETVRPELVLPQREASQVEAQLRRQYEAAGANLQGDFEAFSRRRLAEIGDFGLTIPTLPSAPTPATVGLPTSPGTQRQPRPEGSPGDKDKDKVANKEATRIFSAEAASRIQDYSDSNRLPLERIAALLVQANGHLAAAAGRPPVALEEAGL